MPVPPSHSMQTAHACKTCRTSSTTATTSSSRCVGPGVAVLDLGGPMLMRRVRWLQQGNICSSDLVNYVLEEENIDTIMHFAAQTHVGECHTASERPCQGLTDRVPNLLNQCSGHLHTCLTIHSTPCAVRCVLLPRQLVRQLVQLHAEQHPGHARAARVRQGRSVIHHHSSPASPTQYSPPLAHSRLMGDVKLKQACGGGCCRCTA